MIKERLSAHYVIYQGRLLRNGVVALDENHCIVNVIDNGGKIVEMPSMRFLNGILLPIKSTAGDVSIRFPEFADMLKKEKVLKMDAFLKLIEKDVVAEMHQGERVDFLLIKNIDYKAMCIQSPLVLKTVKWFY